MTASKTLGGQVGGLFYVHEYETLLTFFCLFSNVVLNCGKSPQ